MAKMNQVFNSMPLPLAIDRQRAIPIDSTSVWYDFDALKAYALSGATAYAGQVVTYVDTEAGTSVAYVIQIDGSLAEVGTGAGTKVDGASLESVDGTLRLHDYGKQYYKYVPAQGEPGQEGYVESSYVLTEGWVAGLEPRAVKDGDNFVLGWYEPNTDTTEGLSTAVGSLTTQVQDLDKIVNGDDAAQTLGLVDKVGVLEKDVKGLASAFVFKGSVANYAALLLVENPQNGWVYQVTENKAEYAYDGTQWIELGSTYDVKLDDYVKTEDLNEVVGTLEERIEALDKAVGAEGTLTQEVADLKAVVGTPATEEAEATGFYKVIGDLDYISTIKIGDTALEVVDKEVVLPVFTETTSGLVPVVDAAVTNKENYFLNAKGSWAIPIDARIGNLTYEEKKYNTVEEYVDARINNYSIVWEHI